MILQAFLGTFKINDINAVGANDEARAEGSRKQEGLSNEPANTLASERDRAAAQR